MSDLYRGRAHAQGEPFPGETHPEGWQPAAHPNDVPYDDAHYTVHPDDARYAAHPDDVHYAVHPDDAHYAAHPDDVHYAEHPDDVHYEAHEQAAEAAPLPSRRTSRVSKRVRKRRRSLVFFVVLVAFCAVVYFAVQTIRPMLGGFEVADYPGPGTDAVVVEVGSGATGRIVATELKSLDVVASEQAFLDALAGANGTGSLQPGTFNMKKQMKSSDAVAILLAAGDDKVHYAAVAQNLRIGETLEVLAKGSGIPVAEFEALSNDPASFGLPAQAKNLEGYLSPGEYRFPIDLDAKGILTQMVTATKKSLTDTGIDNPAEQYRVLTIASIIEFEGNTANYAKISGAIENRINNPNGETGGRLESDATVAYGLGKKTYNITAQEKADKTNLYNTFANAGLPVGPIGSPGIKAIVAAAHPETNPYYFWVTINLDTGETLYAATFAEHQANVAKYVAWCNANAGKCE